MVHLFYFMFCLSECLPLNISCCDTNDGFVIENIGMRWMTWIRTFMRRILVQNYSASQMSDNLRPDHVTSIDWLSLSGFGCWNMLSSGLDRDLPLNSSTSHVTRSSVNESWLSWCPEYISAQVRNLDKNASSRDRRRLVWYFLCCTTLARPDEWNCVQTFGVKIIEILGYQLNQLFSHLISKWLAWSCNL